MRLRRVPLRLPADQVERFERLRGSIAAETPDRPPPTKAALLRVLIARGLDTLERRQEGMNGLLEAIRREETPPGPPPASERRRAARGRR